MSDLRCSREELSATPRMRSAALRGERPIITRPAARGPCQLGELLAAPSASSVRKGLRQGGRQPSGTSPIRLRTRLRHALPGGVYQPRPELLHLYDQVPAHVRKDPRLHVNAVLTLSLILGLARGRACIETFTRSLATLALVCERTMHNHLKLLERCGYIAMSRARNHNPRKRVLVIHLSPAARIRHRPLPPEIEAMWALRRSRHPRACDVLAAINRRARFTLAMTGAPLGSRKPGSDLQGSMSLKTRRELPGEARMTA
jgi:hypothetical protein